MKNAKQQVLSFYLVTSGLFLSNHFVIGQEKPTVFKGLPDNVNKIVSVSCVPCHTSKGSISARSKLNFTEWTQYSHETQKAKAEMMYSLINKGDMPPESARKNHPENIPTKDQIDAIKTWSESFKSDSNLYEKTFSTSQFGLAQSVLTTPKGEFHIVVQHRFNEISSDVNNFFGLDYASTRLGFDYGILNWLSAGMGRSMSVKTYDLSLKAGIIKQNNTNVPLSISWYISFLENSSRNSDWTGHESFGSRLSFVNQVFIARTQGIASFQVSPLWIHSNYDFRVGNPMDIFAVDLDSKISLSEKIGLIAEYIPVISDESFRSVNPLTLGLDINTGGHQFQLILSNSQGTNEKEITTNTFGKWSKGHIYFGFNLTRVFYLR